MPSLDHVRWVGGGSGAGKTTVTRLLAQRVDARVYSTDATIGAHSDRLTDEQAPLLDGFRRMDMDQRWLLRDPMTMYRTFPWFHGEGFDLLLDDLRRLPADRLVLVEGFRLLPHLLRPHLSDRRHAVWLLPTPAFRRAAFPRRAPEEAFWQRTSNPGQALANLLERDRIFTDQLANACSTTGLTAIPVDGTRPVEELANQIGARFGLS